MKTTIITDNVRGSMTTQSALQAAGLDWTVSKRPLFTADGLELPNHYGTFRDDRSDITGLLGVVGNKYHVMQNAEALAILDDIIEADSGKTVFSTAGELSGGKQIFASVDLRSDFEPIPGDTHSNYIVGTTSHDGSTATRLFLTSVRVVCRNTLQLAIKTAKADEMAQIKHTAAAADRLSIARRNLLNASFTIATLKDQLQTLASRKLDRQSVVSILDRLFPVPATSKDGSAITRQENKRAMFLELFERNDGNGGFSLARGTAYNAYNAFTEYVDHYASAKQTAQKAGMDVDQIRAENAFFGLGSASKSEALNTILTLTANAPTQSIPQTVYSLPSNTHVLDSILSQYN